MEKVSIDGFEKAVDEIVKEYGSEVAKDTNEVVQEVAEEAQKKVRQLAKSKFKRFHKRKPYVNGWRLKVDWTRFGIEATVYNANKPQLTHLLENGHAKVNGGRVDGRPHINPVNEWVQEEVVRRVEKRLSE